MEPQWEMVTVFRSADPGAEAEAASVRELLADSGIPAQLLDDSAPGVPAGACEVRVPAGEVQRAESILAAEQSKPPEPGDASPAFDLVTVFASDAHNAKMEALAVHGVLDASGIPAVIVGASVYPNLPYEVRVPKAQLEDAQRVIAESRAAGPSAAEEAERASEGGS